MLFTLGTVVLYVVAIVWSVALMRRTRIRRIGALTVLLALLAVPHVLKLGTEVGVWSGQIFEHASDVLGLALSLLAFLTIVFVEVVVAEENRVRVDRQHDAYHDSLTGLPNRLLLLDRLGVTLKRRQRNNGGPFALLVLDVEGFKRINESMGHAAGDELLAQVSQRIANCLRNTDTVARPGRENTLARMGGDEFTILLDRIHDVSDAMRVAKRVQDALGKPYTIAGKEVFAGASIGIACNKGEYTDPLEMMRDADTAMYRAKSRGHERIEVFDQTMHAESVRRLELETELRRAVDRGDFRVVYQPIVSLPTGRIAGFEALVRWQHAERGTIAPAEFIPLAEDMGLIIPIDRWVLRQTCREIGGLQQELGDTHPLAVSVNISSLQFMHAGLVEEIKEILEETSIDPRKLRLEITETVIMQNAQSTTAVLKALQAMDIELHLDDFGTGYSSLSYLCQFKMNRLKVDRSFVRELAHSEEKSEIVRAIVGLAHTLEMQVTAEGIENAEQLQLLRDFGCDSGQGYYFSRPIPIDSLAALVGGNPKW